MSRHRSAGDGHEGPAKESYGDVITDIASAVKTLTDVGMGATAAGDLACKVWCACNGVPCPVEPPAAE